MVHFPKHCSVWRHLAPTIFINPSVFLFHHCCVNTNTGKHTLSKEVIPGLLVWPDLDKKRSKAFSVTLWGKKKKEREKNVKPLQVSGASKPCLHWSWIRSLHAAALGEMVFFCWLAAEEVCIRGIRFHPLATVNGCFSSCHCSAFLRWLFLHPSH